MQAPLVSTISFRTIILSFLSSLLFFPEGHAMIPEGFVSLSKTCPEIIINSNYATIDNFTGTVVNGYKRIEAIFSEVGAKQLCLVQDEAKKIGYKLKIFDAYRPVKAVQFFQDWAHIVEEDLVIKEKYYPTLTKRQVFEQGYIAKQSSHSRGSAVDLTLVDENGNELDMGTIFDFFHERSHTMNPTISKEQKKNRAILKALMEENGFKNFSQEWWHYSLVSEAFPGQYFDFDVE